MLDNALKFTTEGEIVLGYEHKDSKKIICYVRDTGTGIKADKLESVFERFRQADESTSKRYSGAGLGLSISKGLVELMGGKIWAESKENEGTTFFLEIPYTTMMN